MLDLPSDEPGNGKDGATVNTLRGEAGILSPEDQRLKNTRGYPSRVLRVVWVECADNMECLP